MKLAMLQATNKTFMFCYKLITFFYYLKRPHQHLKNNLSISFNIKNI